MHYDSAMLFLAVFIIDKFVFCQASYDFSVLNVRDQRVENVHSTR
ncbi:MAG: hypothetical protein H6Q13_132 [Bacteroidetes bacterium]|nr:hypothetical protein [Bacteroidota bacterium]